MYQTLHSWDNLLSAYRKASRGKRGDASSRTTQKPSNMRDDASNPNVAAFEFRLEDNLLRLQHELETQTYTPGAYHSFYIHEPKKRLISAAPFRDRVVHHALCNLIEPIFERSFLSDSYANRKAKGTHRAIDRAQEFARQYKYVLPCDIKQYFPSIDHAILRTILARKIDDENVMWLIDQILASGRGVLAQEYDMVYFPGDDLFAANRPRGLPIGNLTSQFWANCYLNGFDHFVKRELGCRAYARYVDDFILFADDKRVLWQWHAEIRGRLTRLRLMLHERAAAPRPCVEGIGFLGFILFPAQRRLKPRKGYAFRRRLAQLRAQWRDGEIPFAKMDAAMHGWVNHARYGDTRGLRRAVLSTPIAARGVPPRILTTDYRLQFTAH